MKRSKIFIFILSLFVTAIACYLLRNFLSVKIPNDHSFFHRTWFIKRTLCVSSVLFCFSYVLFKFIYNIKVYQRQKTSNIIFVILFFVTLLIPCSNIDFNSTINKNENRTMEVYKPLIVSSNNAFSINYSYGKDFDKWFNDRFYLRQKLYSAMFKINYSLNNVYQVSKQGWGTYYRFNDWVFGPESIMQHPFDENVPKNIYKTAEEIQKRWNKKILILVYPLKSELYCDKSLQNKCSSLSIPFTRTFNKLNSNPNISVVNVLPLLKKHLNDGELLYFKDEHHMTQYGSQVIIDELIKLDYLPRSSNSPKQYAEIKNISSGEFVWDNGPLYGGEYGWLKGWRYTNKFDKKMGIPNYLYFSLSNKYHHDVKWQHVNYLNRVPLTKMLNNSASSSKFSSVVLGNSFVETLSIALSTRYNKTIRYRVTVGSPRGHSLFELEDEILQNSPNLVILAVFRNTALQNTNLN